MALAHQSIEEKILHTAREEFLLHPYEGVSLRKICAKAGVTTGALYNRYKSKEDLFDALVTPALKALRTYSDATEERNYDTLQEPKNWYSMWEQSMETHAAIVHMLYDNYEGLRILLFHSKGTKHENFLHDFVEDVNRRSYHFLKEAYARGVTSFLIEEEELHMLLTAYWSAIFEPIIHGITREKALKYSAVVVKLFNWTEVLGYTKT